jgi:hypothetical protein
MSDRSKAHIHIPERATRPVSSASLCNSIFHSRTRVPFEPPPSAMIVNSRPFG